jgi:uncharacterized protein (DUF302 family)
MQTQETIGLKIYLQMDFETVQRRVVEALKTEGFGVLTEIDVKDTLKKKLDVDFRPYKILGACNPPLAYRALTAAPEAGLLLPCNVTVAQMEDGLIQVAIVDPLAMMSIIPGEPLQLIAEEARERLNRVISTLEA